MYILCLHSADYLRETFTIWPSVTICVTFLIRVSNAEKIGRWCRHVIAIIEQGACGITFAH
jgi:hypothetical protein